MKRIASFSVDHRELPKGVYISRTDDDIITYDVRMCEPNVDTPLTPGVSHTTEHILATYLRNSEYSDNIIYVGPMGCLTGFYLLTRGISTDTVLDLLRSGYAFLKDFEGAIPGATAEECGNYSLQDLPGAKKIAAEYCEVLKSLSNKNTPYPRMLKYSSST